MRRENPIPPGDNGPAARPQQTAAVTPSSRARSREAVKSGNSMRICMLAYSFYDSDNRVKRYAESLVSRGHDVDVIALRRAHQSEFTINKGVNVFRIQERVVNEKGKLAYFKRLISFLFRSFWVLTKKHAKRNYDVIHVHNVPDFLVFSAAYPKLTGAKLILDVHDILPELYASKFNVSRQAWVFNTLKLIERASIAFSNHVIVANHIWEKTLTSRSVRPTKCSTMLNYPDSAIFSRRPIETHGERFLMMYPGSLNKHQGLDIAVRAFALIANHAPTAEFHIYGEGPERPFLQDLVRTLKLEERVFIKGAVPMEEMALLMQQADLAVVPKRAESFGDEAFSTKILEFMLLGVPLIVSRTRIDQHYFNDSVVKFFQSGSDQDLARCMLELINSPVQRKSLADNAEKFVSQLTWEKNSTIYFELLEKLVQNDLFDYSRSRS